ncbi:putative secreted protein (Por secretion system target) [Chitinophaga sp. S165]|nr:putative secreted protein (Por secretion system target) [Chitinophaga sp. S165]
MAQVYPYPVVDVYVFVETSTSTGSLLYIDGANSDKHPLDFIGSNGGNYIYKATDVQFPITQIQWQGLGVDYLTIISSSNESGSRNWMYPMTEAAADNGNINMDLPSYTCTRYDMSMPVGSFRARFMIVMPALSPLQSTFLNKTICADEFIYLTSYNNVWAYSDDFLKKTVEWEYQVNGGAWVTMPSTAEDLTQFTPADLIPAVRTGKRTLRFHYRFKMNYRSGDYYSAWSAPSDPIEILPAAPRLTNTNLIDTIPSCKTTGTGSVHIAGSAISSGFADMKWLLRPNVVTGPCDPTDPNSNCGDIDRQSDGVVPVSGGIDIQGLTANTYSLWILNPGENEGNCFTPYTIKIRGLDTLSVSEDMGQHKNVGCYNGNDGTIEVVAAGANTNGNYTFTLLRNDTLIADSVPGTGNRIRWDNLRAATYKVQVKNSTCNTEAAATGDIVISQPAFVTAYLVADSPRCASPGDGSIDIQAGAIGGSVANYAFRLYRNDSLFSESGPVNGSRYKFTDLPGGTYKAEVVNNDVNCPGWDSTVTLRPLIPLTLNIAPVDSIKCFGGTDGKLVCTAIGGSELYEYILSKDGIAVETNITGTFEGLSAGDYIVTLKNQNNTCNDRDIQHISIFQRAPLEVDPVQTPISCYGETDARINALVKGGSGSYHYNWQQLENNNWVTGPYWYPADTLIKELSAGTYRVIITDNKATGCSVTSAESIVNIATEVKINSITVHDAVCLADGAHIDMTGTGGTGNYLCEWSANGGNYTAFTDTTDINTAGNYRLRLSDGHGCTVNAPATYDISLPSAPIGFTYKLSDYAGFNISCKGNDNGFAQITATGGNGGNYNGYMYSLDDHPYGTNPLIEHITAGTHYLHVKDGRGCIVTHEINMTEPAAVLALTITSQEHNGCGADPIGNITVAPQGGSSPYTYAIDDKPWQIDPVFNGLIAEDYNLSVKDATGCITGITTTLTSLYPSLSATAAITDVNCYGESNGALRITVSGGDGIYAYQWNTPAIAGTGAENIAAGDYDVTVTDSKGCKQVLTYTVSQPEPLELAITAPPVCDGLSDGSISALITGGTTPYQYSLDHSSWLPAGTFSGLPSGNYHIAVQDAHHCAVEQDVTLAKANVKPDINFLVASRKNAFDTLVIKEINVPAPDNVSWSYHPAAISLGGENGSPLIKFTDSGTYWVEMAATFGSCTYTLRKELEIGVYDPNAGPGYSVPVHVIDTVTLSPNPNNGNFNFKIKLNRKQQIVAYVYDMNGIIAGKKQYAPTLQVDDSFVVGGSVTGTFILRIITESESKDVRFIISR